MPDSQIQNHENRHNSDPEAFHILRTAPNKDYTDILHLGSQIMRAAVALVIVEHKESWVKTTFGISADEVPKQEIFWRKVLQKKQVLIIEDLEENEEFRNVSIGPYKSYVGVPLLTKNSEGLGVLMFFGKAALQPDEDQRESLNILTEQILNLVIYRKQNDEYLRVQQKLEQKYRDLEKFASVVSHDIKSPLANIISLVDLLKEENKENFNDETKQYIDYLSLASHSLRSYVDGLLIFYRSDRILERDEEDVDLEKFFSGIVKLYNVHPDVDINYPSHGILQKVNKSALTQIFMNLISNALKYNNKELRQVDIHFAPTKDYYYFEVKDNGNGIPEESFDKIFDLFTTLDLNDREGHPGSGIGLATVKKLLDHMGGEISVESEPGKGSNFKFKIKRLC